MAFYVSPLPICKLPALITARFSGHVPIKIGVVERPSDSLPPSLPLFHCLAQTPPISHP